MGVAGPVGVDRLLRIAGQVCRVRRPLAQRSRTQQPFGPSRTMATAPWRSRPATASTAAAGSASPVSCCGLLGVAGPHRRCGRAPAPAGRRSGRRRRHRGRARRRPRASSPSSHSSSGSRVSPTSENPLTQTRSPSTGADVCSDSTLIRRSAPWVVTKVRSALGSIITKQIPVSRSGDRRAAHGDALGRQRGPHQVTVRAGAHRAGQHARRPGPRRRDEDVDRSPGIPRVGLRDRVAATRRQRVDLDHLVDQRLRRVDDPRTARRLRRRGWSC